MSYIIMSDAGFLATLNSQVVRWSDEYPDALLFRLEQAAVLAIKTIPITVALAGGRVVSDYGLDSQCDVYPSKLSDEVDIAVVSHRS